MCFLFLHRLDTVHSFQMHFIVYILQMGKKIIVVFYNEYIFKLHCDEKFHNHLVSQI